MSDDLGPLASRSLGQLLAHAQAQPEHVAIWIARDAHPQLSPASVLCALDELAHDMQVIDLSGLDAQEQGAVLAHHLAVRHGFEGNRRSYHDPENHYIDSVLKRHLGVPISLATVYIAVARRVSIRATPIGFPGHFLLRIGDPPGALLDPFDGRLLVESDLEFLLSRALGPDSRMKPEYLAPTSLRAMAQRMLSNLKRIHEGRRDRSRALVVLDRLVEVEATPENRRDRGLCALSLGAHRVAASDLAHYLLKRSRAPDAGDIRAALERARKGQLPAN